MVKVSLMVLVLLSTMAIVYVISASEIAIAQPITESAGGMNVTGNQTSTGDLVLYSNPNLGFSLEYPSDWRKEEGLTFISPQGGIGNRAPEIMNITSEVLPTSDYSLDSYTEAALSQVELFKDLDSLVRILLISLDCLLTCSFIHLPMRSL